MTKQEYEVKTKALIAEIQRVFDGIESKNGVTLHEADVIDDYGDAEFRAKARLKDTETRWQDVPDEAIQFHNSILSFLDARGFHYYSPAHPVWDLRFMDCEDEGFSSNTFDSIKYKLLVCGEERVNNFFFETFSLFNLQKKNHCTLYSVSIRATGFYNGI